MALGMEVGLGPGDFVWWGPSYPKNRGHTHHHPVFGPCSLWPNGWMDEDDSWYGSRPQPRPHCIRRGPSSAQPPSFWPVSTVATVAHLSYCWALVEICEQTYSHTDTLIAIIRTPPGRELKSCHVIIHVTLMYINAWGEGCYPRLPCYDLYVFNFCTMLTLWKTPKDIGVSVDDRLTLPCQQHRYVLI